MNRTFNITGLTADEYDVLDSIRELLRKEDFTTIDYRFSNLHVKIYNDKSPLGV